MDRFGQIEPRILFAADGYLYNGKEIDLLPRLRQIAFRIPVARARGRDSVSTADAGSRWCPEGDAVVEVYRHAVGGGSEPEYSTRRLQDAGRQLSPHSSRRVRAHSDADEDASARRESGGVRARPRRRAADPKTMTFERFPSITRFTSCTPRAPPGCPSAWCTAPAAPCCSISRS